MTDWREVIINHGPEVTDDGGENTPMPRCFWCGAYGWSVKHRDDCKWKVAQAEKRADKQIAAAKVGHP